MDLAGNSILARPKTANNEFANTNRMFSTHITASAGSFVNMFEIALITSSHSSNSIHYSTRMTKIGDDLWRNDL